MTSIIKSILPPNVGLGMNDELIVRSGKILLGADGHETTITGGITSRPLPIGDGNILNILTLTQNGGGAFLGATVRGPRYAIFQNGPVTSLQLLFCNFGVSAANAGGPAAITFGCSLEVGTTATGDQTNDAKYPLTFGGRLLTTLDPEGYIWSDPINLDLTTANFMWPRTYFTVPSTGVGFVETFASVQGFGEGWDFDPTTPPDNRNSGTITINTGNVYMWGPIACRAVCDKVRLPVIGLVGDSIISASGETASGYTFHRGGWAMRGLASRVPVLQSSRNSATTALEKFRPHLRVHFDMCDHVITATGVNDLSGTAATLQANLITLWKSIRALGPRVWQATITPLSTSTDSFATVNNQTASANNSKRVAVNAWIRAGAPVNSSLSAVAIGTVGALLAGTAGHPLAGYIEVSDYVEYVRDSGTWKAPGYTTDGTHPSTSAHIAISATLSNLSRFENIASQ